MSHLRNKERGVGQQSFASCHHELIHPAHKIAKSQSALQLYVSLQGSLQLPASSSNPQLLPTRNLTVRNLSARRLKPEECYCSGHSCTSSGRATAATVWGEGKVGGEEEEEGRREESKVWKRQLLCVSSSLQSYDKAAHSWQQVDTFLGAGRLRSSPPCWVSSCSVSLLLWCIPLYLFLI